MTPKSVPPARLAGLSRETMMNVIYDDTLVRGRWERGADGSRVWRGPRPQRCGECGAFYRAKLTSGGLARSCDCHE